MGIPGRMAQPHALQVVAKRASSAGIGSTTTSTGICGCTGGMPSGFFSRSSCQRRLTGIGFIVV
jgi:hypothetical protein